MTPCWSGRRVLVTGAAGMIGSWLVKELLERGAKVTCLVLDVPPQSEFHRSGDDRRCILAQGALEDYGTLLRVIAEHQIEAVFHLAARTIVTTANKTPLETFESNVRGTYNLLEACRLLPSHVKGVIVASSDKAYGDHDSLPYTEETPLQGRHPYDVSKSAADLIAQSYFHTYHLPVTIARCGNVYGGGDLNWDRIVPGSIRALLRDERPVIRSDGKFTRDYVYVKDIAAAYIRLAECLEDPATRGEVRGGAFNFSSEQPLTVVELVAAIRRLMRREHIKPDIQNTAWGEIRDQYLSSAKAARVLGWRPAYSLDQGLRETIEWYEAWRQRQE
jgi:CDP-glucose 4,6-dehydratase